MLMAAALHLHLHMDSAARGLGPSSSSSTSPPQPWFPADDNYRLPAYDFITASAPSPPTPATAGPAPPTNHLRPVSARRVSKRRPRPSRKLPTTYITADPASFRRMVHQVTGADNLPLPVPPPAETLCRPAPYRAAPAGTSGGMMLPTLDTSAFLLGAPSSLPATPDQAEAGGAAGLLGPAAAGGGGACSNYNGSSFPTLDSWDPLF
ncbi:unnamed protein product [Urochloa decumbens]|uniref:VQ domain-containing protein n=1 Tax=Urochloa decumbens TaxID=240449 RepID=A0ABC8WLW6_9POAL